MPKRRKKKSKEEIEAERLAQEEEERRIREEERYKREAAALKAAEDDFAQRTAASEARSSELERLRGENEEDTAVERALAARLSGQLRSKRKTEAERRLFTSACSPLPDPSSEPDMRAFLAEQDEEDEEAVRSRPADRGHTDTGDLSRIEVAEQVAQMADAEALRAAEEGDRAGAALAREFARKIRATTRRRLDGWCAWTLANRSKYTVERKTGQPEISLSRYAGPVRVGIWGNAMATPLRLGRADLGSEVGVRLELPRALTAPDSVIRVVRVPVDVADDASADAEAFAKANDLVPPPCSALAYELAIARSKSRARRKSVQTDAAAAAAAAVAAAAAAEASGDAGKGEGEAEGKEGEEEGEEGEEGGADEEVEEGGKPPPASGAGADNPPGAAAGAAEGEAEGEGEESKEQEEPESEAALKIKQLSGSGPVPPEPRKARARTDPSLLPSDDVPLGGVVFAELLTRPGEGKTVKRWHMQRTTALAEGVERRPHPNEGQGMAAAARLYVRMPDDLLVPEDLRVCYRDVGKGQWVEEEDCGPAFDQDTRELAFKTTRLAAMALVVPREVDIPYKGWSARPVAPRVFAGAGAGAAPGTEGVRSSPSRGPASSPESACLFTLDTARLTLQVLLQGDTCALLAPRIRELGSLLHRPMRPSALAEGLWRAGVLVRPAMEDADRPGLVCEASGLPPVAKDPQLEESCAAAIATCSAAFEVQWSRWNQRPLGPRSAQCQEGAGAIHPRWPAGDREAAAQHAAVLRCRELMVPPHATVGDPEPLIVPDSKTLPFVSYGGGSQGAADGAAAGEAGAGSGGDGYAGGGPGGVLQRGKEVLRESAAGYGPPVEGHETDWRTAVATVDEDSAAGMRWWLCSALEESPVFDPAPTPGAQTHTTLLRALAPRASAEAAAVAQRGDPLLQRTVRRWLALVKPMSFC